MATIREDNIKQPEYDPFDAPIPGQSLTDTPGNYPWEHPPKTVDPEQALDKFWNRLTDPEVAEEIVKNLVRKYTSDVLSGSDIEDIDNPIINYDNDHLKRCFLKNNNSYINLTVNIHVNNSLKKWIEMNK